MAPREPNSQPLETFLTNERNKNAIIDLRNTVELGGGDDIFER